MYRLLRHLWLIVVSNIAGLFANPVSAANIPPLHIIAAENFYGDIAQQIGGQYVQVTSILHNPNQDPHLFSASVNTARALTQADIVVYNGIGYDPWLPQLLSANRHKPRVIMVIADLLHKRDGDNPHLWYDPHTMPLYAQALTQELAKQEPAHAAYFLQQQTRFLQQFMPLQHLIATLHAQYQGTPVIATEPVFGDMAQALGLKMYGEQLQLRMMNDTEPSAANVANFENRLRQHQVKVLLYNNQVANPLAARLKKLAQAQRIPVVGVSETQPGGMNYVQWMVTQLQTLQTALQGKTA